MHHRSVKPDPSLLPLCSPLQVRERALRSELQDRETELRGIVAEVREGGAI